MYSQDGLGLGHLRRSYTIAHAIRRRHPGCNILILADSPAISLFAPEAGIELLKLPTVVKTGDTTWRNSTLSTSVERSIRLRARVIAESFAEFRPDTVIVDHMPVGALGELKPMLERASGLRRPPRLFLGLRDILDRPAVIRQVWEDLGAYDYLHTYDAVLIYGSRAIYDAAAAYRLSPGARAVRYCNYVTNGPNRPASPASSQRYVLMMGGGGQDAFPLAKAFVEAHASAYGQLRMRGVVLAGPNMSPANRAGLVSLVASPVRVEHASDDPSRWIRGAAAVVTMGGYNSLCEVLRWRKKALVVPRPGPSAEQRIRGRLFGERGLVRTLDPTALDPEELAFQLLGLIEDDGVPDLARIPLLDGAERAADAVAVLDPEPEPATEVDLPPSSEVATTEPTSNGGLVGAATSLAMASWSRWL